MKYLIKFYTFIFFSIIAAIIYLYFSLQQTQEDLTNNINKLFVTQAKEFAANIQHNIHKKVHTDLYKTLKEHLEIRQHLEHHMRTITTQTYKYIYILYRDKKGNYRYLLDGSKEDRGEFGEKLNVNKEVWDKVYSQQKPQLIFQNNLDGLWVTYLEPVVFHGKTEAVLAMDFSTTLPQEIANATKPLNNIFSYIFVAIVLMLIILLYQTFLNFKTKKESITDPLTQTYNRNYLRDLLTNINIAKYQILMLDIDHFKSVNDTYGHKVGDFILSSIAKLIQSVIRSEDILVRFGGEEFLLFIHRDREDIDLAENIAQRIRETVQNKLFCYEDLTIKVTVSIGVTSTPEHFKSIGDAIKHADEMLYVAKRNGRNQVITDASANTLSNAPSTQLHINDIQEALDEDRLICHYQAIFSAKDDQVAKYEALVRIQNRDGSCSYPNQFLPTVMHTNIYNQITKKVIEIVFAQIKAKKIQISMNLNFSDIVSNDIFAIIIEELEANKDLAKWLVIELLEYELLETSETFINNIERIKSFGVAIAIDDFGTGFANYHVFETLPIDIIKIDGSLIKNIDTSQTSRTIVKSIIALTQDFGIESVAEFVHSQEVYAILKELGVTHMQGFYLAKPQESLLE